MRRSTNLSNDYANANGKRTGQLTKILNNLNPNKDRGYTYDALGRLVQATGGPATAPLWTQNYAYDRYGNRTSVSASGYTASNRGSSPIPNGSGEGAVVAQHSVTEPRAVASGSKAQLTSSPRDLLAFSDSRESRNINDPLSDSPPRLFSPPPQSGPPTFTDDPLVAGSTVIKALHITELRTWINSLRVQRGLQNHSWQKPTASGGAINNTVLISWEPIDEMRNALNEAIGPPTNGYASGLAQGQPVLAIHIQELRDRVKNNWYSSVPIPRDGHAALSYDATSNRITTAGFAYDDAGNQVRALIPGGTGSQRYQYDAANRLVRVKDDNQTVIASYTYGDSNERLIAQDGDESSNYRTYYVGEGGTTIAEYSETPSLPTTPQWSKSYVYLGNRLLSTLTPNGGGEAVEFHHPDRLGTRIITNPSNRNLVRTSHTAFRHGLKRRKLWHAEQTKIHFL